MPMWNGPVLTLARIINVFMPFTSEAELGALFITAQETLAMRNMLEEITWPQPKSPI